MRAFSSKKYQTPKVFGNSIVLVSVDGTTEIRVYESIKFIDDTNKTVVYRPEVSVPANV